MPIPIRVMHQDSLALPPGYQSFASFQLINRPYSSPIVLLANASFQRQRFDLIAGQKGIFFLLLFLAISTCSSCSKRVKETLLHASLKKCFCLLILLPSSSLFFPQLDTQTRKHPKYRCTDFTSLKK